MSNFDFKIYRTEKGLLTFIAETFNLKLEYLGDHGERYVSNGEYLRVFCKDSYVDLDENIKQLPDYKREVIL